MGRKAEAERLNQLNADFGCYISVSELLKTHQKKLNPHKI